MRYSTAVLSAFAVGQAAAAHGHNRHQSFHSRREAAAKRSDDTADVNWANVAYDMKSVDWDNVNYGSPTAAAAATSAPVVDIAENKVVATTAQYGAAQTTAAQYDAEFTTKAKAVASATTSAKAAASSSSDSDSSLGDAIGDLVSDLLDGVEAIAKKVGCLIGKNDKSNNGGIWVGKDSKWTVEFTNDANKDAVLYCWKADGYTGMIIKDNQPEISVGLKSGEAVELSFAENVPAACSPVYADSKLAMFGGVDNTWFEVTFAEKYGTFDISRNVNMNGCNITAKGSKCTSDMSQCVFKCKDQSVASCEAGSDYDLFNCDSSSGGGGGFDSAMQGTGGGCAMAESEERIVVAFGH